MKDVCSYCQREYGTISMHNRPIFRTIDHIKPLVVDNPRIMRLSGSYKKKNNDGWRGVKQSTIHNILLCCNECNELKGSMYVAEFARLLPIIYKEKRKVGGYLTKELVQTIINSCNIIKLNKSEPIVTKFTIEYDSNNLL